MGKNQSASNLTNIIQYNNGNITFVSGSTTLMQISSSGAITITGVISGSNALSASYALSASNAATASSADNFLTRGTLTAQTLVVQTITSSVSTITGSTNFGSTGSNTHQFTGSIYQTGSVVSFIGNVGVGVTLPSASLHIDSSTSGASGQEMIRITRTSANQGIKLLNYDGSTGVDGFSLKTLNDTNLIHFQMTNGNVGIGTTVTSARLHVSGTTGGVFEVDGAAAVTALFVSSSGNVGIGTTNPLGRFQAIQNQNGTSAFYFSNATSGTSARSRVIIESDASAGSLSLGMHSSTHASTPNEAWIWGSGASTPLILGTIGSERVRITPGGNVAIGNTGSAWNIGSPVLQMGSSGVHLFGASTQAQFGSNAFYDGTNYKFIVNNWATRFIQNSVGGEMWFERSSASGTAGNNITFNTSMYISNSGSVGIGTTSPEAALEIRKLSQTIPSIYFSGRTNLDNTDAKGLAITHYYSDTGTNRQLAIYNPNYPEYPYIRFVISNINYGAINAITGSTASLKGLYLNDSLYIASGGSVGIGTTAPATKLHVVGAIGNGTSSTNPTNVRFVKTGTTSVVFTISIPNEANWNPGYATIRVAGSRTGLEEQYAAMYFLRLTYYGGSGVSAAVNNVSGDTGSATVSVSANTASPQVVTITVSDVGATTNYLIADIDVSFNTGVVSIS